MPQQDQDLNYKVKLDTADLAAQLQQVRAQIDQAVGSVAFNSTAMTSQPSQFAFPIQDYARQAGLLVQADMQNIASAVQMGGRHVATMTEAAQLGFQKFNNDVQNALLTQGPPLINTAAGGYYPNPAQQGFSSNAAAALIGWGYNPRYSITPGEFSRLSGYRVADQMIEAGVKTAGSLSGGWLGGMVGSAVLPGIGTFVGEAVGSYLGEKVGGLADDTLGATILRDFTYGNKIKEYAWESSWRFLGGRFSRAESERIGENLASAQRSESLVGYDMRAGDISRVISEFTEIGGFDNVRSAQEYQTKAKTVIENHRKIMQTLKTTETEALALIKELSLLNPSGDIEGMATKLAISSYATGLTGREAIEFAKQSSEMVRGTGISMSSAFMGGLNTLELVRGALENKTISSELINQFGGIQNYALNLDRVGYNWAQSTSGLTQFAAASAMGGFGNTIGMTPTQTMGAAVGYLMNGGIQGMLEYSGTMQARISNQNPAVLNAMGGFQIAEQMYASGLQVNRDSFMGIMQMRGISAPEAEQTWNLMWSGDSRNRATNVRYAIQLARDSAPGVLSSLKDVVLNSLSESVQSTRTARVARNLVRGVENFFDLDAVTATRRIGVHEYDFSNFDISKTPEEEARLVFKEATKAGAMTTNQLDALMDARKPLTTLDWARAQMHLHPNEIIDETTLAQALKNRKELKYSKAVESITVDEPTTNVYLKESKKWENRSESVLNPFWWLGNIVGTAGEVLTVTADMLTDGKSYKGMKREETVAYDVNRFFQNVLNPVKYFSGAEYYYGKSELNREKDIAKNIVSTLEQENTNLGELNTITAGLKNMGATIAHSPTLSKDPMLVLNQMNAEVSARGADAMQRLLTIQLGPGFKVHFPSVENLVTGR